MTSRAILINVWGDPLNDKLLFLLIAGSRIDNFVLSVYSIVGRVN
jgi:hypothetical protein